jgi:hypothetical protein
MQPVHVSSAETPSGDELHWFLRAAVEAADALAKLHQSGIIHQNIRPHLRRCLSELEARGRINSFPLGARDVWDKLRASSRMYGRREELAALRVSLDRVRSTGRCEVCLISGPSGIGKSSLVGELRRGAGRASAAFLTGKFEENKRDIPYATLGQAFQDLIRQTVAKTDAELAAIRAELAAALGDSGQLIIDIIPQVELIIGKQPPAPPLGAADARNRFHLVFRSFLGVFTAQERPLVLFLDDLQWADCASLELLQHLLTHPDTRSLLVLGAYRSDEVSASHPLEVALAEIQRAGVPVTTTALGPLAQRDLVDLVVDLFRCERDDAKPLAAVLWTKAAGNPFFAVQLLGALHQDQLIHFDPRRWAWVWDITAIEAQEITSDMVELVLGKLRRLPEATLDALKLAAFIGIELSVELLGTLSGKAPEEVQRARAGGDRRAAPPAAGRLQVPARPRAPGRVLAHARGRAGRAPPPARLALARGLARWSSRGGAALPHREPAQPGPRARRGGGR